MNQTKNRKQSNLNKTAIKRKNRQSIYTSGKPTNSKYLAKLQLRIKLYGDVEALPEVKND